MTPQIRSAGCGPSGGERTDRVVPLRAFTASRRPGASQALRGGYHPLNHPGANARSQTAVLLISTAECPTVRGLRWLRTG